MEGDGLKVIGQILGAIFAVIGALSAIKSLLPEQVTYQQLIENIWFLSGWGVSFLLALVLIYQEDSHKKNNKEKENLLGERSDDKKYLKEELSRSNISLNHLTSRLERNPQPIPRAKHIEENDEFQ